MAGYRIKLDNVSIKDGKVVPNAPRARDAAARIRQRKSKSVRVQSGKARLAGK